MISFLINNIDEWTDKYQDPKAKSYPLASTSSYAIWTALFYIVLVKFLGPKLMENRNPFKLKKILILYNCVLVFLNGYMFIVGGRRTYFGVYSLRCEPMNRSTTPEAYRLADLAWLFYFSKYLELLDTIFFVMRKKYQQVSLLHVSHHSIMLVTMWFSFKMYPTGNGAFMALINSFVHVIMYFYYMLSAFGPRIQKYLKWKKYLTILQMVQFFLIFCHSGQIFFNGCDFPWAPSLTLMLNLAFFFYMFARFYYKTYIEKKKTN